MDIPSKISDAEARFEQLRLQGDEKRKEVEEIEDELKRIQGEHRALVALKEDKTEPDEATTIVAKEKKNGK